ncbi:pantoate--beta-alanine ligase [Pseudogracilibacillus sp. SE30717A]|uniref:pantoate--beta-alanine ligase n=1 Tax=Pseudogracilibacillus sp. SE30717A TaxID=3098293 RepID=UPI00300E5892
MKIIRTVQTMMKEMELLKDKKVGFVPTMGYLHEGHLSLVETAKKENDIVIMSIFVNPLQFGPNEDFDQYPRDEQKDAEVAKQAGVSILFIPTVNEMYPDEMSINMTIGKGSNVLCGKSRPGHFDGVITVLTKLFHMTQPTNAYFGLKDAQQFAMVNSLISELNFPIQLIGLPTVRESDGLAKSSRNVYLSSMERTDATALYSALKLGQKLIVDGIKNPVTIIKEVENFIRTSTKGSIDYVELLSFPNLENVVIINEQIILAVAVKFKKARLIDNIILNPDGSQLDRIN